MHRHLITLQDSFRRCEVGVLGKISSKAWRKQLETMNSQNCSSKFKARHLSNVLCMPSTLPPTNKSVQYFPRFVKIVRGFKKKKKKENGKKSLAADMLVPGCFENPNARLAEKIQKLWRTIHLWFSIATDLLLQSFQRYEENISINKAFFFSYIMYTHCTCRQQKKRHVCNALPKNGTAPQRHILRTASRWRRTREHSRAC